MRCSFNLIKNVTDIELEDVFNISEDVTKQALRQGFDGNRLRQVARPVRFNMFRGWIDVRKNKGVEDDLVVFEINKTLDDLMDTYGLNLNEFTLDELVFKFNTILRYSVAKKIKSSGVKDCIDLDFGNESYKYGNLQVIVTDGTFRQPQSQMGEE